MSTILQASATLHHGLRFDVQAGAHALITDYPLQADDPGQGPRPLELLLGSLAACAGGSMAVLLKRQGQTYEHLSVQARGVRRDQHPTVFESIELAVTLTGPAVDIDKARQALSQSEESICPIWAMLKPGVPVTATLFVDAGGPAGVLKINT